MQYFIFLFVVFFCSCCGAQDRVWLLIDTERKKIEVKQGSEVLEKFEDIAIGRKGASLKQRRGDNITPIGTYKITYTNNQSHFRKFFGLNYPSTEDANFALLSARISYADYQRIMRAHEQNRLPPQNTVLGGQIGIHGVGQGNKTIHGVFNWTRGCIALSNPQVDRLAKWIYKGMQVRIK